MANRKRIRIQRRTRRSSPPVRRTRDPRSAAREVWEVRRAQVGTGEELRNTKVPIAVEPALVFKA